MKKSKHSRTAVTDNYMIERVRGKVNLLANQGGMWMTIRKNISLSHAIAIGFNENNNDVISIFRKK